MVKPSSKTIMVPMIRVMHMVELVNSASRSAMKNINSKFLVLRLSTEFHAADEDSRQALRSEVWVDELPDKPRTRGIARTKA
jgi:hypothetical protein